MSPISTLTQTATTYSLPLTGRATPPLPAVSPSLRVAPLVPHGVLTPAEYPRLQLTPAVGVAFGNKVQLKKVLQMEDYELRAKILHDLVIESASFHRPWGGAWARAGRARRREAGRGALEGFFS